MVEKKRVVIDGVIYELGPEEYKILKTMISYATVIGKAERVVKPRAGKTKSDKSAGAAKPKDTDWLKSVLGEHYGQVFVYDNVKKKILTPEYNGQKVFWNAGDDARAAKFKQWFDDAFEAQKLKLLCSLSKQVSKEDYPGWCNWTTPGKRIDMARDGSYSVCNFIVENKETKKMEMFPAWLGYVEYYETPELVAAYNARQLALMGVRKQDFQQSIVKGWTK